MYFTGVPPPDWLAFGPVPIIISSGLHYYTFFYLFVSAALMSIDSSLEEAGELAGASRFRILGRHLPTDHSGLCFPVLS